MEEKAVPDSVFEKPPIVDRDFAEKFMVSVDRPLEYGVYFLINDWWDAADQGAIDQYLEELHAIPGAQEFLAEKYIAPTMTLEGLRDCAPGTLGAAYRDFVEENNLIENFARDYRKYYSDMIDEGRLKRMPEDMAYMSIRATQLHDFMHVLTGYGAIATAVAAVKIGATDYLSKPADANDVTNALLATSDELPPPPENPMSADRVRWEHIQRVYELCDRNVSETARRLNMHRRTLQRILAKRSPR